MKAFVVLADKFEIISETIGAGNSCTFMMVHKY